MIKIPLAEHFHSLQGEGRWAGLPMHFLRLPGCTVGRTAEPSMGEPHPDLVIHASSHSVPAKQCTSYDGRHFWCDTDYAKLEEAELAVLIGETWERDVCFTGGEPLMHEKHLWYKNLYNAMRSEANVHVETSGTILPALKYDWLTVSPKLGWLPQVIAQADQVKILVDSETNSFKIGEILAHMPRKAILYFSPIFDPNEFIPDNFHWCEALLKEFASFRPQVSVQMHKFLGLR